MASLHSMFAQMERNKHGLLIAKQMGHLTGRKRGIKKNKLDEKDDEKKSIRQIAKELNVDHSQLLRYIKKK